jgi:hypothetical protein
VPNIDRRAVMKDAALGMLSFSVGGTEILLTPRQARAQTVAFRTLRTEEAETLEALGEILLPSARDSGIAHFVDQQVSGAPVDCLLMARIANVKPPFINFYRASLAAIDGASLAAHQRQFAQLTATEQHAFVDRMRQNKLDGWKGPAQPFVYFITRQDAVDVVYGTVDGFKQLGIPYMAHIQPAARW